VIARVWRGWTSSDDADAYVDYLVATGMKDSRATPGNRGVLVLRRAAGEQAEFTTVTLWETLDAVDGFAGTDRETAVFYPEDERFLVEREWTVGHHEVVHADLGDDGG
jgi:heme-degrading monooxygenase HmoA